MTKYDVYDAIQTAHPELMTCVAGLKPADRDKIVAIIDRYQADWDAGKTFLPSMMFFDPDAKRSTKQDAEEFDACTYQASGMMLGRYLSIMLAPIDRVTILATLNTVVTLDYNAGRLHLAGFDLRPDEIMSIWSKAHPDERPLQFAGDFEI